MWAIMCVCHHVCHTQARSCLSTGWALNRRFAWFFGTVAVLAQGGGGGVHPTSPTAFEHLPTDLPMAFVSRNRPGTLLRCNTFS